MDVWYVDHRSLSLDLRILWRTFGVVLGGRGVGETGSETMSEFRPDGLEPGRPMTSASRATPQVR